MLIQYGYAQRYASINTKDLLRKDHKIRAGNELVSSDKDVDLFLLIIIEETHNFLIPSSLVHICTKQSTVCIS